MPNRTYKVLCRDCGTVIDGTWYPDDPLRDSPLITYRLCDGCRASVAAPTRTSSSRAVGGGGPDAGSALGRLVGVGGVGLGVALVVSVVLPYLIMGAIGLVGLVVAFFVLRALGRNFGYGRTLGIAAAGLGGLCVAGMLIGWRNRAANERLDSAREARRSAERSSQRSRQAVRYRQAASSAPTGSGLPSSLRGSWPGIELFNRTARNLSVTETVISGLLDFPYTHVTGLRALIGSRQVVFAGEAERSGEAAVCGGAIELVAGRTLWMVGCQDAQGDTTWSHRTTVTPGIDQVFTGATTRQDDASLVPAEWVGLWTTAEDCSTPGASGLQHVVAVGASAVVGEVASRDVGLFQIHGRREGTAFSFTGLLAEFGGSALCSGRFEPLGAGLVVQAHCTSELAPREQHVLHLCARTNAWPESTPVAPARGRGEPRVGEPPSANEGDDATGIDWSATARAHRGEDGRRFQYRCPADGDVGSVWGTGVYTDDSSICTAAAHAGRITVQGGGTVTIQIAGGRRSYRGSTRHGVESSDYDEYPGSFRFVSRR